MPNCYTYYLDFFYATLLIRGVQSEFKQKTNKIQA